MAMNSRFTAQRYPYLPLALSIGNLTITVEALVDTGFDGFVIVPAGTLPSLDASRMAFTLADGSRISAPTVRGAASIERILLTTPVAISELGHEAIVGRGLIDRLKLTLDHGRELTIET